MHNRFVPHRWIVFKECVLFMSNISSNGSLQDLLNKIRQEQTSFSAAQRQVAAYVLENHHQIPFLSISSLARNIGVSNNSVIKFCNQLGYAKFAELKRELSAYAHKELVIYNKISESAPADGGNEHFSKVTDDDICAIRATLSDSDNHKNLPVLLGMIDKASHIYITGGRVSGSMASFFASALRYLDLQVHEVNAGIGDYWDRMSMITKDDLVIAISLPRYTAEVVNALKMLKDRGVPIALITDTGLSPAHPYADVAFHCTVNSSYYHLCYSGCMSLISVVCRAVSTQRKQDAAKYMHQLESSLLDHGVFL